MRRTKKTTKREGLTGAEAKACGLYFGASNLTVLDRATERRILSFAPDWSKIRGEIDAKLASASEDDAMYAGYLEECRDWQKRAEEGDRFTIDEWRKDVARATATELEPTTPKPMVEGSNVCVQCGTKFSNYEALDNHMLDDHSKAQFSAEQIMEHWISSAPRRSRR